MAVTIKDIESCIGCGACVKTCPCDVFRLVADTKKTTIAYPEECQVCGMCSIYCPEGVLIVTPDKVVKPITAYM